MRILFKEKILEIPEGVEVTKVGKVIHFNGPLGSQSYDMKNISLTVEIADGFVKVKRWHANRKMNALLGTISSHINNHMIGVSKGFKYVLRAAYKHFSINMSVEENGKVIVVKNFLGEAAVRKFKVFGETKAYIGENKDILVVEGINLEHVSQSAAQVNNFFSRKKKTDCRIFLDGIYLSQKLHLADQVVAIN